MPAHPMSPSFYSSITVGPATFHEDYFQSDPARRRLDFLRDWCAFPARLSRYDAYWKLYEGSLFQRANRWSDVYKRTYGLYEYTRTVLSPASRIGEFWATHLYAGSLDPDAGPGNPVASACPIVVPPGSPGEAALRGAVARMWRAGNWQAEKEKYSRFGSVCGDAALMPVDDPARRQVRIKVYHPSSIVDLDRDDFGNVKGYRLEEYRPDPREPLGPSAVAPMVRYTEIAERVGRAVRFSTYLDESPHDWRDYPDGAAGRYGPEWTEDYGFTPLVFVQHKDVGRGFGWSVFHSEISKFNEVDDGASKVGDYVRKAVDCPWFLTGVPAGTTLASGVPEPTAADPYPERDRYPTFSSTDPNARAFAMVADLNVTAASAHYNDILKEIKQDYPELEAIAAGGVSGRAMRVAKENVTARVIARRAGYDDGLARAQMMGITMGAIKGYEGFTDFDAGSFDRGELAHSIGPRPVFALDEEDRIDVEQARANAYKTYRDGGMSIEGAMRRVGYAERDIDAELDAIDRERARGLRAAGPAPPGGPGSTGDAPAGGNNPGRPAPPAGPMTGERAAWRRAQFDTTLGGVRR